MNAADKVREVQAEFDKESFDGWLIYDFCRSNDLACLFLDIDHNTILSRRFFYWIPRHGEPIKVLHRVEPYILDHFPGKKLLYSSWHELEGHLKDVLQGAKRIAMEYSPRNAVPYVSKVDAGTMDVLREFGLEVDSSANLLQSYTAVLDAEQEQSHYRAMKVLEQSIAAAWALITASVKANSTITEYDVQQFMMNEVDRRGCTRLDLFCCSVNEHAADPHHLPTLKTAKKIQKGDFILLDVWAKLKKPRSIYADISKVGVAAEQPTKKQQEIFSIVKGAQTAGLDLLRQRFGAGESVMGWEVDSVVRKYIEKAGYAQYFTHRTGHSMYDDGHGPGAHIDSLETKEFREIIKGTLFSIEPGIYLPGEFGIRLECDVFIDHQGGVHVTGGLQDEIVCLL